jgi:hypothetical protein
MGHTLRTILIGLLCLAVLLGIYLLYSRVSKTPPLEGDTTVGLTRGVAENDTDDLDGEIGKIGDVGVGTVKKFEYLHRNDRGEVDRKFGFKELLHQTKGRWEVNKPYMDIFLPTLSCNMTADRGNVQMETAAGGLGARDATFTGNVVMHILPGPASDVTEGFAYLDDIAFVSDKSLFFTEGPVRYVSRDFQMQGMGLELIYNDELSRLESFRIVDLDSLRFRSTPAGLLGRTVRAKADPNQGFASLSGQANPANSGETIHQDHRDQRQKPSSAGAQGEYYRCVFSRNVFIDSPEHLVFADEKLSISNIFWSRGAASKDVLQGSAGPKDANSSSAAPTDNEPNKAPEDAGDIVITCDGGITITAMDSPTVQTDSDESVVEVAKAERQLPAAFNDVAGRPTTIARSINHDASAGDTQFEGPVELNFFVDVNDLAGRQASKTVLPLKVTAQNQATYSAESHQVVLQDDCVATMLWDDPNVQQKYTLSAGTFTIDLPEAVNYQSGVLAGDVKHLTADGGLARLTIVKSAGQELLGGVELKCVRLDYDAEQQLFEAKGPGILVVDNSKIVEGQPKPGGFSLRKQCYAFLQFFDTLKYFMKDNRIVADAKPNETLQIDYFPVVKDQYGQHAVATASHIEAKLVEAADGRNELSTLTASGAVTYEDEANQFAGGDLFYDREKSILRIEGDESTPCHFNGALVRRIVYDLKTGKVEAPLAGPGTLQIKR